MACLLQPECNFLHGYFRCKLPVEVVDVEVKITSMQGTHIFRRDRMTQLVRCVPWTPNLQPHPNMVKKMRTFLEVENKMGPIIPAPANQYRLPLPEMNPNVRKGNVTKKRRTVTPKRKFRPIAPKATATCSPLPKTPPKKSSNAAAASMPMTARQDTPWPGTGNMSGNLFQDRNWLLPKDFWPQRKRKKWQSPTQNKKTKWRNKIPKRKSVVGGLDALYAKHRRKRPILPIKRNQWKINSNRNPYPNHKQYGPTL